MTSLCKTYRNRRVIKPDGTNTADDSSEDAREAETTKQLRKSKIIVAGDSILENLHGWMMARSKSLKVHSFPGAMTEDMICVCLLILFALSCYKAAGGLFHHLVVEDFFGEFVPYIFFSCWSRAVIDLLS